MPARHPGAIPQLDVGDRTHPVALVAAVDPDGTSHRATQQAVHDVARSLLALPRPRIDHRASSCAFVDRGAHHATGIEVDDEVGETDEQDEGERRRGHELDGRQTIS